MSDLKTQFGRKVRHFRMKAGLTQADLAERLDVTTEMVGKMERGTTGASFVTIEKLCEVLQVSAGSLFPNATPPTGDDIEDLNEALSKLKSDELLWVKELLLLAMSRPEKTSAR